MGNLLCSFIFYFSLPYSGLITAPKDPEQAFPWTDFSMFAKLNIALEIPVSFTSMIERR